MTHTAAATPQAAARSRRRRLLWAGAGAGLLLAAVLFTLVIVEPVDAEPTGDAVVVHAGGRGERLETAQQLMADGAAPTLVAMYLGTDLYPDTQQLCGRTQPYEIICPAPEPVTTIGEAREIGDLVEARGWDAIVIVTTDYHVRRAKLLDDRCTDAAVAAVAAGHQLGLLSHAERVGHEMLGLIQAFAFRC